MKVLSLTSLLSKANNKTHAMIIDRLQKNLCYVTTDLPTSVVVYQIHVWFHSFPFDARSRDYVLRPTAVPSGGT